MKGKRVSLEGEPAKDISDPHFNFLEKVGIAIIPNNSLDRFVMNPIKPACPPNCDVKKEPENEYQPKPIAEASETLPIIG